jgi:hypothetical protein
MWYTVRTPTLGRLLFGNLVKRLIGRHGSVVRRGSASARADAFGGSWFLTRRYCPAGHKSRFLAPADRIRRNVARCHAPAPEKLGAFGSFTQKRGASGILRGSRTRRCTLRGMAIGSSKELRPLSSARLCSAHFREGRHARAFRTADLAAGCATGQAPGAAQSIPAGCE